MECLHRLAALKCRCLLAGDGAAIGGLSTRQAPYFATPASSSIQHIYHNSYSTMHHPPPNFAPKHPPIPTNVHSTSRMPGLLLQKPGILRFPNSRPLQFHPIFGGAFHPTNPNLQGGFFDWSRPKSVEDGKNPTKKVKV